jgi:hypothetical protein
VLAFRIIAFVALGLLVLVLGSFFWTLLFPGAGQVDSVASRRIYQLCGFEAECKVRIGDLFNGDWDTFYEFGEEVPQSQIDQVLGSDIVLARARQRVLVFVRHGHVVLVKYSPGTDQPFEGQIAFESERHREERVVRYPRNAELRVTAYPVDASSRRHGVYYVLSSVEAGP